MDSKEIRKIAMLCIHSNPVGELGTRDTGGMSVYIRELARELSEIGLFVDVFTLCRNHSASSIIPLFKHVRLISLKVKAEEPITKENLFDYLPAVLQAFNETAEKEGLSYDLIHSHYWLSGLLGNQIKQLRGISHVTTFHTLGAVKNRFCPNEAEPDFRIEQEKELMPVCDRIIASTQREAHDLISIYYASKEKIGIVPAGVNLKLFTPLDKAASRRKLGFNDNAHLLLYVGRYVPIKGLDRLLKIMPDINYQNRGKNRFRLLVIGGEDEHEKLSARIKDLNIQKAVSLIGRIDQELLPAYYSAADMLVVPSYHESFCLAGFESLACGTPVVATPVGGLPAVINRQNGCILATDNDRAMAEAIVHVANNQRRGFFSPEHIRSTVLGYAWSNTAKIMLSEYQKIPVH